MENNQPAKIVYRFGDGVYINLTNRCPNLCAFCIKTKWQMDFHGNNLNLQGNEPSPTQVVAALDEELKKAPLIAINDLKSESDKNEQDGIRYMLMGFFQGPRNLYQHNHIGSGASNSISVIIEASFFLHLLDGHSITQNGRWIPVRTDYRDIYNKMPKPFDRWRMRWMLRKRAWSLQRKRKAHFDKI